MLVKLSTRRLLLRFFAAARVGTILSGCGMISGGGGMGSSETAEATAEATGEATGDPKPSDGANRSKPPESTLFYGGQTVTGVLGSFCWALITGDEGESGTGCFDVAEVPIPPKGKTLAGPAGATLGFDYGGEQQPNSVEAGAYPLIRGETGEAIEQLEIRRSGDGVRIPAELPAGSYVIDVLVYVPEGDASYYFRALVE
jgi:hypothetical protein